MNAPGQKVAVVTGSGSGIGAVTAKTLAEAGYSMYLLDRSENVEAVAEEIRLNGGHAQSRQAHVTDLEGVTEAFTRLGLTVIDALINAAGIREVVGLEDLDGPIWQSVIDVNLTGTFNCIKAAHHLLRRPGSTVVNFSSVAGKLGVPGRIAYTAAKHGIIGLTKALSPDLGRDGIRVNAVCPGITETSMTRSYFEDESIVSALKGATPLRRWAQPQEIAALALFLVSDAASFLTGAAIDADGGYGAVKSFDTF